MFGLTIFSENFRNVRRGRLSDASRLMARRRSSHEIRVTRLFLPKVKFCAWDRPC